MKEALILMILIGVAVVLTTGHQAEEGAGESAEAAVGAGEAGGGEEADGGCPAEGGAGVLSMPYHLWEKAAPPPLPRALL